MKALVIAMAVGWFGAHAANASVIDYAKKDITLKLVYYGPGLLEANLRYIYGKTKPEGKEGTIAAQSSKKGESYWYLPLTLGEIRGFKVHIGIYTVPQGAAYADSRKFVLEGADGIVFVADSNPKHAKANTEALDELTAILAAQGRPAALPFVFQITGTNKPSELEAVKKALGVGDRPVYVAKPASGTGVFDTLKTISKLVLTELKNGSAPTDTRTFDKHPAAPAAK